MSSQAKPNTSEASAKESADSAMELPELQDAVLDPATLTQLFHDIEHCTELLAIIPKYGKTDHVLEEVLTLTQARTQLELRQVRGIQLRYRHNGSEWWDTLMLTSAGVRLVRIRHEIGPL